MFNPFPHSSHRRVQTSLSAPFPRLSYPPISQHRPIPYISSLPTLVSPSTNNIHSKGHPYTKPHRPSIRTPRNSKRDRGARNSEFETGFFERGESREQVHAPRISHPSPLFFYPGSSHAIMGWDETHTGVVAEPVGFWLGGWSALFSKGYG